MRRWRQVCQERAGAVERLRTCITRRRIAFRVFKQWYWESFDEDVQVCRCYLHPLGLTLYPTSVACVV